MEENNITNIEETNQDNKTIKVVLYIIIFIIAITSIILAVNGIDLQNKPTDEYELVDDYEKDEKEEDDEEEIRQPVTDPEFPNHTDIDKIIQNNNFQINNEDKINLINSSNTKGYMSDEFLGEMFKEKISNEYKLYYTISFLHQKMNEESLYYYGNTSNKKIKKETLLKYAKMLFDEVDIPENINKNLHYKFNYNLTCYQEICTYNSEVTGLTGTVLDGYETNIHDKETESIVDVFYIEYNNSNIDENDSNFLHTNIIIKDKHNGKTITTLENYKLQVGFDTEEEANENSLFNELSKNIEESPRYIFKFDDKNTLLSVEQG